MQGRHLRGFTVKCSFSETAEFELKEEFFYKRYNLCTWIWMALLHIYDEVFHEIPRNVYPVDQSQQRGIL